MNTARKLAHVFVDLPTHTQFEIAKDFGVYENEQLETVMTPTLLAWVKRIVARGLLASFTERVFSEHDSLVRMGFRQ